MDKFCFHKNSVNFFTYKVCRRISKNKSFHEIAYSYKHRLHIYTDCSLSIFLVAPLFPQLRPRNNFADFCGLVTKETSFLYFGNSVSTAMVKHKMG